MKEVEEEGVMESTTLLSKPMKVTIIPEKEQVKELEEVEVLQQNG